MTRTSADLWSAFWRSAHAEGCTFAFPAHRRAALATRWRSLLSEGPPGRLLDVACGRGAVLLHARAAGWSDVCGVDISDSHALHGADPAIQGGIDACVLPFPDGHFATVTSQFGIEYAGMDRAVAEASRVCADRMILLLHAADGVVVAQAREQAAQALWIDEGLGGFTALHQAAACAPGADHRLAAVIDQVDAQRSQAENVLLLDGYIDAARMLSRTRDMAAIADMRDQWRDHAVRLREMATVAPAPEAVEALAARMRAAGFASEILNEGGDEPLIGRWLILRRRGQIK